MTRLPLTRAGAGLALAASIALLAGCAGPAPAATTSATPPPAASTTPTPTPSTEPTPVADPACDTIIPSDVVDDFEKAGWAYEEDVFRVGATEVPGGIWCTWGDMSVASDHVQIFGWAPITPEDATKQQSQLLGEGWIREDAEDGVYLTESPDTAAAPDEDGYGWTYHFSDGAVIFADTKQGLLLVEWPPAG